MGAGRISGNGGPHVVALDRSIHSHSSSGFSYVEVMVAIVLVGVTVIAVLVGLRTTVISARVGTERSQLLLWVQEGAEALHREDYVPCTNSDPQGAYQSTLDAVVPPNNLDGGSLVVDPPKFLSVDPTTFTERWNDSDCDPTYKVAALRITATSSEGTAVDLEVILDG